MSEYRVSFNRIEDGVATFALYKDEEFQENIHYDINDLPEGVDQTQLDDQFRPEFEDGEIVALDYGQELTERKHEEFSEGDERFDILLRVNTSPELRSSSGWRTRSSISSTRESHGTAPLVWDRRVCSPPLRLESESPTAVL